jgi:hypothetical protein
MPMQFPGCSSYTQHAASYSVHGKVRHCAPVLPPSSTPAVLGIQQAVEQLAQALMLLQIAAGQGVTGSSNGPNDQQFWQGLSPTARQAEAR